MKDRYHLFPRLCVSDGLPKPASEYKFAECLVSERWPKGRKWAFDFCWINEKVALEVDGGVFSGGRHTRGVGFVRDMEKLNAAACLGWRVLRVQPKDLMTKATSEMISKALNV